MSTAKLFYVIKNENVHAGVFNPVPEHNIFTVISHSMCVVAFFVYEDTPNMSRACRRWI